MYLLLAFVKGNFLANIWWTMDYMIIKFEVSKKKKQQVTISYDNLMMTKVFTKHKNSYLIAVSPFFASFGGLGLIMQIDTNHAAWKLFKTISVQYGNQPFYLQCKSNDWFLYEM